jgi:O-antigen/teichoic acid export membrane protein
MTTSDMAGRTADSEELAAVAPDCGGINSDGPTMPRRQLTLVPTEGGPEAPDAGQPGGHSAAAEPSGDADTETEPRAESRSPAVPLVARKNIAFNVSVLAGSQAVTWSLTLVWTVIVPRLLGPSGMGEIVTATSVASILGVVLGLGTKTFLVREIVVAPDRAPGLIGTSIVLRTCLIPAFAVAVIAYSRLAHLGNDESWVLYLATGATVLMLLTEPIQAAFQAFERMEYLAYSNVVNSTLQIILGVSLALVGFRARGLTACMIFVVAVVLLLNVWWARKHVRIDLRSNVQQMRSLVKDSLAYWSFALFYMIYLWIDTVILSLLTNSKVVGWYGVSTRLFTTLMFVPAILSMAWLPRLVSAFEASPRRLHETARRPIELVLLLGLPICVLAAMTSAPIIRILFGPGYSQAAPVLTVLALVLPLMYLNIMLNQVVVAAKRQSVWTWIMAGATVVNPLFNIALIPLFQSHFGNGAIGAAIALGLTEVLIVGVGFLVAGRQVLTGASTFRWLRTAVAGGAMWAVMYATRPFGFVASAVAGVLIFTALVPVLRLASPDDWAALRQGVVKTFDRGRHMVPGRRRQKQNRTNPAEGVANNA